VGKFDKLQPLSTIFYQGMFFFSCAVIGAQIIALTIDKSSKIALFFFIVVPFILVMDA
jgi:hypothetical protein